MRVIALVDFHDNAKDVERKRGEEFVVSRERFEEINRIGEEKIGEPLVRVSEHEPAPAKETPESRAAKAPSKRRAAKKANGE